VSNFVLSELQPRQRTLLVRTFGYFTPEQAARFKRIATEWRDLKAEMLAIDARMNAAASDVEPQLGPGQSSLDPRRFDASFDLEGGDA
jgi:hypothetical protein